VSAWLNVGLDPILGVDQSHDTYWRRIYAYFHGNKNFESNRTKGSLMNHWSGIQHYANVFCGCVFRIETRNHSGWTVDVKGPRMSPRGGVNRRSTIFANFNT